MEDKKEELQEELMKKEVADAENADVLGNTEDTDKPLDQNVKLMSPMRMVLRRFFRSKLSIAGLVMLASLFLFCWLGPLIYHPYSPTHTDKDGMSYTSYEVTMEDGTVFP